MTKVIVIGGKGTAVVVAEQIVDARTRYGVPIEFIGFAFDDPVVAGNPARPLRDHAGSALPPGEK
jgi:hypothetical protein